MRINRIFFLFICSFDNFKTIPLVVHSLPQENLIFTNIFNIFKHKGKCGISSRWYYPKLASLEERSRKYSISALSEISWQAATARTSEESFVPDDSTERYLSGASVGTTWTRTALDFNHRGIDLRPNAPPLSTYSLSKAKCHGVI